LEQKVQMAQSTTQSQEKVMTSSVYNLMRRLPPNQVAKSLAGIGQLIEDETFKQQLFDQIDQPLGKCTYISSNYAVNRG